MTVVAPRRAWPGICLVLLLLGGRAVDAGEKGDVSKGRTLAVAHCALCHVVGDHNKFGGIGSTPSFRVLASIKDGLQRFLTFFARRPHPTFVRLPGTEAPTAYPLTVPEVKLTPQEVMDIAAFAMTLKDPKWLESSN